MKIYYRAKEIWVRVIDKKKEYESRIVIQRCETNSGIITISRLTEYIETELNELSLNTQLKHAKSIVQFINFLIKKVQMGEEPLYDSLREQGLYGYTHYHLSAYITYTTESTNNQYDTVKDKEKELIRFIWFLSKRKITGKEGKIESVVVVSNGKGNKRIYGSKKGTRVWLNPLDDKSKYKTKYPKNDGSKKANHKEVLKDLEDDMWEQLLEYAETHHPKIALGVALQMMGGLRKGEVVNVRKDDVEVMRDRGILKITVRDNGEELFGERGIKLQKSQVKPSRVTIAIVENFNGRLMEIYDDHLERLAVLSKKSKRNVKTKALFLNSDGEAMSGNSYENEFSALKSEFIELVGGKSESIKQKLENHRWGSHIGRHVFTNYLIRSGRCDDIDGTPSIVRLQLKRRDLGGQSAQGYIDTLNLVRETGCMIGAVSDCVIEEIPNEESVED